MSSEALTLMIIVWTVILAVTVLCLLRLENRPK